MGLSFRSRGLLLFLALLLASIYLLLRCDEAVQESAAASGAVDSSSGHRQLLYVPDAFVLIAMGHTLVNEAVSTSVLAVAEACVCSLRATGGYTGDIFLVTDDVESMQETDLVSHFGVILITYPYEFDKNDFDQVMFTKSRLLEVVPSNYTNIIYMDTDIMVTQPLEPLLRSIAAFPEGSVGVFSELASRSTRAGFEVYNAGFIAMQRGASEPCLADWSDTMTSWRDSYSEDAAAARSSGGSGGSSSGSDNARSISSGGGASSAFNGTADATAAPPLPPLMDDQEALNVAIARDLCAVVPLPGEHMKFMTDWPLLLLRAPAVLSHYTRTARGHLQRPSWLRPAWRRLALYSNAGAVCMDRAIAAYAPPADFV
ncbi:hypothetical protein JKP88DRAFT_328482 [Tribonema minus]|uniref:Uncharacterized protein n=1 Tax=Tribonema minus TaxID=303371 RepID=A0A836CA58_9STRA|nr:hypothetical protein JKP88DRAFT_328482 [Tribonema minus]